MKKVSYANIVQSMIYAMIGTRPDLAYGVSLIMSKPTKDHWQAVKWLLRYLKCSAIVGLVYKHTKEGGECVKGFCDSNYASNLGRRRC